MPRFYAYFSNGDLNSGWRFVFAKNDVKNNIQQQLYQSDILYSMTPDFSAIQL